MIRILFVCVQNAGRSQMAEAFAKAHGAGWVEAFSAGSQPADVVHPAVVTVMQEKGVHLEGCRPKGFAQLQAGPFNGVVTMGCGDACPAYPGARRIDWVIPDPKDQPIERVRQIHDEIEHQVQRLLRELSASLPADRQKQRYKGWFGRSIFAIGLSFLLVGAPRSVVAVTPEGHELIGTSAAEWHVSDWFNSVPLSLRQLRGKVVLVRWWTGPECPYCAASAPNLDAWYNWYHAKGLEIIGFYHHKSPTPLTREHVQRLVERYPFRFPVAIDPDWRTLKRWWLEGHDRAWTSVSFLIDQQGVIRYIHPGGSYSEKDVQEIESMIQGLLEGHSDAV